jgi:hypothetical protein
MPVDVLHHCFLHTQSKLIIVDWERADRLEPSISKLGVDITFLVLEGHRGKRKWNGMRLWEDVFNTYIGNSESIITTDPNILPEDNASIVFTSGTRIHISSFPLIPTHSQGQLVCLKVYCAHNGSGSLIFPM